MTFRTVTFIFSILLCAGTLKGQQQATFSQYMFNTMAINPAYAGHEDVLSISALARYQSLNVPGAPNTQTLSIHGPLLSQKASLGVLLIHDNIGVIDQYGLNAIYAYRISLPGEARLSFGLQAGVNVYDASYSELAVSNPNDPAFTEDIKATRPNFGFGVFYHSQSFYAGLSTPHLVNNVFNRGTNLTTVVQDNPIIFTAGYVFHLSRAFKLKPSTLLKLVDLSPVEYDFNLNLLIDNVLWVGASVRTFNAVDLIIDIQATNQIRIGYSYAITTNSFNQVDLGSHEFMLNYKFKYPKDRVVTPRHF